MISHFVASRTTSHIIIAAFLLASIPMQIHNYLFSGYLILNSYFHSYRNFVLIHIIFLLCLSIKIDEFVRKHTLIYIYILKISYSFSKNNVWIVLTLKYELQFKDFHGIIFLWFVALLHKSSHFVRIINIKSTKYKLLMVVSLWSFNDRKILFFHNILTIS